MLLHDVILFSSNLRKRSLFVMYPKEFIFLGNVLCASFNIFSYKILDVFLSELTIEPVTFISPGIHSSLQAVYLKVASKDRLFSSRFVF